MMIYGNCSKFLIITYDPPGSGGYHHVNCRPEEYTLTLIISGGMSFEQELTQVVRNLVAYKSNEFRHFIKYGLIFSKKLMQ